MLGSIGKVSLREPKGGPHVLFRKTLLPGGGASTGTATFFAAGLALALVILFLLAIAALAAVGLVPLLIIVVPVEVPEVLLLLLTERLSTGALFTPRLGLVVAGLGAGLGAGGLLALRPNVLAFARVDLVFPITTLTALRVAAIAADLAGATIFGGIISFNGEVECDGFVFCGGSSTERIGDWGRVRELDDFGESTVEGLSTWRDASLAATLVRFLGFNNGSGAFSLPEVSISVLNAEDVRAETHKGELNSQRTYFVFALSNELDQSLSCSEWELRQILVLKVAVR